MQPTKPLPEYNFGILINSRREAAQVGEIAEKYYNSYSRGLCNFNGNTNHVYYVQQIPSGARRWNHCTGGSQPSEISHIFTLAEFKRIYLERPAEPVVINNYQIY